MSMHSEVQSKCFLTWIEHRRTRELCHRLDLELAEIISVRHGLSRYLDLIPRTIWFLRHRRPSTLLVQSPSIVLSALALLLRPWFNYRLVLDAHNEAVEPYLHRSWPMLAVSHWLIRRADRVIVTNQQLADVVTRTRGTPIILLDPLPKAPVQSHSRLSDKFSAVVVSTFAGDEPFDAICTAAQTAGDDFHFFVTGNPDKLPRETLLKIPSNVILTGFLPDVDYWNLLASTDVVIDLTTLDNCLVCGAYEAIAAGKPLVLSNNPASVATFVGFAQFTDNTPQDIVAVLMRIRAHRAEMALAIPRLRTEFEARWIEQSRILLDFLEPRVPMHAVR